MREPTTFTVRVVDKDNQPLTAGQLSVVLSNFGTQQVAYAAFDLAKANPVTCTGTLHEPGFLKCTAVVNLDKAQVRGVSGAAYEPEKIVAGSPRPADFDTIGMRRLRVRPKCRLIACQRSIVTAQPSTRRLR